MTEQANPPHSWYRRLPILAGVSTFVVFGIALGLLVRPGNTAEFDDPRAGIDGTKFTPTRKRPKLVIKPKPGSGAVDLAGSIVDQAGRPVGFAAVSANFELGPGVKSMDTTGHPEVVAVADESGTFKLVGLDAGRYRLKVEGDDIFTSEVRFIDVPRDPIKLIVARIVEIQGVVIVGNTPMADVEVSLRGNTGGVKKVVSGRDGRFAFEGLSEGVYQVWVASADQAAAVRRVSRLGTGPFADVVLQVEPASIVSGVVRDKDSRAGVVAALVLRSVDLEEPPRYATSTGDGAFSIEGVPNGRWTVEAYAPGYIVQESVTFTAGSNYAPTLLVVRGGVAEGRVVDQHGGSIAGATVTLRRDGKTETPRVSAAARADHLRKFRGQETIAPTTGPRFIERGELGVTLGPIPFPPPPGAVVTSAVESEDKPPGTADDKPLVVPGELTSSFKTDHNGAFRVRGLAPGRYRVLAAHADYAEGMSKPFNLVLGKTATGLRVRLIPGVLIIGKVTNNRGEPILGAVVSTEATRNTLNNKQAVTASDGTYELGPIAHDTTLKVSAVNHGDAKRTFKVGPPSIAIKRRTENFVLASADSELRGRVIDPSRFAVRGARVVIVSEGPAQNREATTNDNGLFSVDKLAAGKYSVRIEHASYPKLARTLVTDKDTDITLRFGGTIEGSVRDGHTSVGLDGAQVNAVGPGKGRFDTSAEKNGALKIGPIAAGKWTVTVKVPGYVSYRKSIAVPAGNKPGAVTVRNLRIELHRGAIVAGTVLNANGERVRAAKVWVVGHALVKTVTDEHGRFRLAQVPAGDVVLKASRKGIVGQTKLALRAGDNLGTIEIELKP